MKAFCIFVVAAVMLTCFGIEGTLRKLHSWGESAADTTQRVYCDLHRESCDYIESVRKDVEERKAQRRRVLREQQRALTEEQWRQLDKRGQSL